MQSLPPLPSPDEFRSFLEARALAARVCGLKPAVAFDRDGTLASVDWVRPVEGDDGHMTGWHRFNAGLPFDAVVPYTRDLLLAVPAGVHRFMFSGRAAGDKAGQNFRRWQMLAWLDKHALPIDTLLQRQAADQRPDDILKNEFVDVVEGRGFALLAAVDDRPSVCDGVWRARSVPLVQVVDPALPPCSWQRARRGGVSPGQPARSCADWVLGGATGKILRGNRLTGVAARCTLSP